MRIEVLECKKPYDPVLIEFVEVSSSDIICTSPGGSAEGDDDGANADGWY